MTLGSWGIIKDTPSLLALIPLLIFIVCTIIDFKGKGTIIGILAGVAVGFVLTGQTPVTFIKSCVGALTNSTMLIGFMIIIGAGLGEIMNEARISNTIVYWIIERIGINTKTKGKIVLVISSILVCGLLGTLAGGNAIIAPIIIPILASLGITPTTTAVLFRVAGEIGLILGPLTGVTLMACQVTGLSYLEYLLYAAIPFAIFWLFGTWIGANITQKRTEGKESYELNNDLSDANNLKPSKKEERNSIIFVSVFVALIVIGVITKQSTAYSLIIIVLLTVLATILSGHSIKDCLKAFGSGAKRMLSVIPLLVFFTVLLDMVAAGDGFTALANFLTGLFSFGSGSAVNLIAALVGGFGIETSAILEIQIIAETFKEIAISTGLPMKVFVVSILAATRLTSSVYPTSNFIGQMITARSDNTKDALIANWVGAFTAWIFVILISFIGPVIF